MLLLSFKGFPASIQPFDDASIPFDDGSLYRSILLQITVLESTAGAPTAGVDVRQVIIFGTDDGLAPFVRIDGADRIEET